ncbi:hypothetical protein JXA12_04905 [Candidatus Woesearchaeota archaeon]|nr:hypothetical protein [Candidatus Woesearchaeota archaeon]
MKAYALLAFLVVMLPVAASALVSSDLAPPQIIEKPLLVTPGEQLTVSIYNGGKQVWTDLAISVAGTGPTYTEGILGPGMTDEVQVEVPLIYLLSTNKVGVTLSHDGAVIDRRDLPVRVDWPAHLVVMGEDAAGEPELLLIIDTLQLDLAAGGIQVEVVILEGEDLVYFDYLGPFYVAKGERFVHRAQVPERYLGKGDYTVRATFFDGDGFLAETETSFTRHQEPSRSFASVLLLFLTILFLILFYLVLDMAYHRRSLKDSWLSLRR